MVEYPGLGEDPNKELLEAQFKIDRSFDNEAPTTTALAGDIDALDVRVTALENP